jgi:hypothetical protein
MAEPDSTLALSADFSSPLSLLPAPAVVAQHAQQEDCGISSLVMAGRGGRRGGLRDGRQWHDGHVGWKGGKRDGLRGALPGAGVTFTVATGGDGEEHQGSGRSQAEGCSHRAVCGLSDLGAPRHDAAEGEGSLLRGQEGRARPGLGRRFRFRPGPEEPTARPPRMPGFGPGFQGVPGVQYSEAAVGVPLGEVAPGEPRSEAAAALEKVEPKSEEEAAPEKVEPKSEEEKCLPSSPCPRRL